MEPFPHFELFKLERTKRVGRFLSRLASPFQENAPDYMSEHYHGAEGMLEAKMDDWAATCPDEVEVHEQLMLGYAEAADTLTHPFRVDL